jgi:lambda family phage portal protein
VYRVDRAGQVRGVPWFAPVILRMRDFDELEGAQLVRTKIAACFAGFVQDIETPDTAADAKAKVLPDKIEPGAFEILPPGKTITFPNVPQVADGGHAVRVLRSIAAGLGITYESLSGDLSGVNFSSGRMGWIEMQRNIEQWRWQMLIPRFSAPVYEWFALAAALVGTDLAGASMQHTPPRREMIDPTAEVAATIAAIRGGLQSLPEAVREQGLDFEDHVAAMKKSNEALDAAGLILDSDPRRVMKAGILQSPTAEALSPKAPPAEGASA